MVANHTLAFIKKMPAFQRYCPLARYCLATSSVGFSLKATMVFTIGCSLLRACPIWM